MKNEKKDKKGKKKIKKQKKKKKRPQFSKRNIEKKTRKELFCYLGKRVIFIQWRRNHPSACFGTRDFWKFQMKKTYVVVSSCWVLKN